MKRTNFYRVYQTKQNGQIYLECDFLHNSLSHFVLKRRPVYHYVSAVELKRPYLISYRYYGDVRFWWVLCLVNKIANVFEDLKVGDVLIIPSILDIYDFQKKYRIRKT